MTTKVRASLTKCCALDLTTFCLSALTTLMTIQGCRCIFPITCLQTRVRVWTQAYFLQSLYVIVRLLSNVQPCDPINCSGPGFPVLHHCLEFAQTRVHWFGDATQPPYPLLSPSPAAQSFPAPGAFLMSWFFMPGGQSTGASGSASVLLMNIRGWFPLGLTSLISFLSKRLSRVFSSTTVRKHWFFGAQPSLWFNSHLHTIILKGRMFNLTHTGN